MQPNCCVFPTVYELLHFAAESLVSIRATHEHFQENSGGPFETGQEAGTLSSSKMGVFRYPSDADDRDVTARSDDKPLHIVRVARENHRALAKSNCDHNGVNHIRRFALR